MSIFRLSFALAFFTALVLLLPALARAEEERDYIVVFKQNADLRQEVSELKKDGDLSGVFRTVLRGAAVSLTPEAKEEVLSDSSVAYIEPDRKMRAARSVPNTWGLDRIDQRNLPLTGTFTRSATGSEVLIYVVDTGIKSSHEEFTGRLLPGAYAIGDGNETEDCNGHGTHVAGIAAGSSYGVAPEAKIVPVRVLNCQGSGNSSGLIAALEWIANTRPENKRAVANMSLGFDAPVSSVDTAIANLVSSGTSAVVAAGNDDQDACATSPGRSPTAITVGSTSQSDERSYFSNWGSCLDLFAPGSDVLSAWHTSSSATQYLSGTSMAAPHVAGAAALKLQAHDYSPTQVRDALVNEATSGVITNPKSGSANKLLYVPDEIVTPPGIPVISGYPMAEEATQSSAYSFSALASKGSAAEATLRCRLNEGPWQDCGSGSGASVSGSYSGQDAIEGVNTVEIYATGDGESASVTRSWIVDSIAPGSPEVSTPASPAESSSVSFDIAAGEDPSPSSGFYYNACSITLPSGGIIYPPCNTSLEYAFSAGYGTYDFVFKTVDLAGNESAETKRSVVYADTSILEPPVIETAQITGRNAAFFFTGQGSFECKLNAGEWANCTAPKQYTSLPLGQHTFYVRSLFLQQISESSSYSFQILKTELAKPQITAFSVSAKKRSARITFSGEEGATLQCRLNQSSWKNCSSPTVYKNLRPGKYTFRLRQKEGELVSPVVSRSWQIPSSKKNLQRHFLKQTALLNL